MNNIIVKECRQCGIEFTTNNKRKKYCSNRCKLKHHRKTALKAKECKQCGQPFKAYKSIYCSDECRNQNSDKNKLINHLAFLLKHRKECKWCGSVYQATKTNQIFCSYDCSYRCVYKKKKDARRIHSKKCKECGKHYSTTNNLKVFCSHDCGNKYADRIRDIKRRKQIKANGRVDWDISVDRLVNRDKGICYLCNHKVDVLTDVNSDSYPSIEHVIPVAKGGTHTWDNVKLAHRKCNYEKSDRLIEV